MLWLQGLVCLAAWLALGVVLALQRDALFTWARRTPGRVRRILAPVPLLASAGILVIALNGIEGLGGLSEHGLSPGAWVAVGLIGAVFVSLQVLAAALAFADVGPGETGSLGGASMGQAEERR
jgi:hypothetical protein